MLNQKWAGAVDAYRKNLDPKRRQMVEMLRTKNQMGYNPEGGIAEAVYSKPLAGEPMAPSMSSRMSPGGFDRVFGTGKVMPPTGLTIQKESVSVMPAKKQSNMDRALESNSEAFGENDDSEKDFFGGSGSQASEGPETLDSIMGKINNQSERKIPAIPEISDELREYAGGIVKNAKSPMSEFYPKIDFAGDLERVDGAQEDDFTPRLFATPQKSEILPGSFIERNPKESIGIAELLRSILPAPKSRRFIPRGQY